MITKKAYYPACAIAFLSALFFGIVTIGQIYFQKDTYPVSRLFAGCDYFPIYNATLCIVRGYTIYENIWFAPSETIFKNMEILGLLDYIGISDESWYCYPPLFAYLNSPLIFFDMDTASRIMFFLLIAAVLCAYFLTTVSFESFMDHERTIDAVVRNGHRRAQPSVLFSYIQVPSGGHSFFVDWHGRLSVETRKCFVLHLLRARHWDDRVSRINPYPPPTVPALCICYVNPCFLCAADTYGAGSVARVFSKGRV